MKRLLSLILILSLLLLPSGCGKNKAAEEGANISNEALEGERQKGGEVCIYSYKPDTLCPLLSLNNANVRMLGIVFDGLFTVGENLSVVPCLAESFAAYDNNTRYIVKLKKNILFHDKSVLCADDVVYSVNTAKSEPEGVFYHNVSVIKDVKALDGERVEFILQKPIARFANLLDFPIIKKVSGAVDKENFFPNGTGGFMFEDRNEGNLFHLVKNPDWWGGEVYLDSIRVRLLPDKDTSVYAFSSGELSICPAENDEWGKILDTENAYYKKYMTEKYDFIGLNHKNELLKKDEMRKALLYIIDREAVLRSGAPEFSEESNAPFRRGWTYTTEEKSEAKKSGKKARELIEKCGFVSQNGIFKRKDAKKTPLKFDILINEESYEKEQFAKKISEELSEFGISSEIKKLPFESYVSAINSGSYDMFIGSVNLSKELDFEFFFGEGNMFFVNDKELLDASKNMQFAADEEDFGMKTAEFIKLFNEKVPFIGIGFEDSVLLYKSEIGGELNPVSNDIYNGIEKLYIKSKK